VEVLKATDLWVEIGGIEVLRGVDFSLSKGEKLFLTGDNGAGKTTFIETLMGFVKPLKGQIFLNGSPVESEGDWRKLRLTVGYVFQNPDDQLFCPTVEEEIAFAPLVAGKSRREVEEIVSSLLSLFKIEHLRLRPTHKLSGGEKRIVSIAAVLAMEPELLILDEPTVGLDRFRLARLEEFLRETDCGVLVVTHERELIDRLRWRRLELKEGRLLLAEDG